MYQKKIRLILWVFVTFIIFLFTSSASLVQRSGALPPLKIVHLGDSYSAGNGARSSSGARNYHGVEGCYRSPTNWGSLFADSLKDTFAVTYINRACSGGVANQITEIRDMKESVSKNLDGSCPTPDYSDEEFYIEKNEFQCSRFLTPQIDAIDESVDLVLMTMGGNDLGFATIVRDCFTFFRTPSSCEKAVKNANAGLPGLEQNLINKFAEIRANLRPDARVVFVSYPFLLPDDLYQLGRDGGMYDAGEELRSLSLKGDEYQKSAVRAANNAAGEEFIIFFDGTKALFEGHEPDPSVFRRNPERWVVEFEGSMLRPFASFHEWYHPNALGHENWGRGLSIFETFDATGGSFGKEADVDIAFVVDTTGSMADEIAQVRMDLSALVDKLAATTNSYRVAVVSYRDFPERTGDPIDYPYRVDQSFTNNLGSIQAAIDSLSADGGDDIPETVFSGIQAAIELPWRPGVTKTMIVVGDAPALSPEPISNLTASQIIANSIAVDPVQVIGVDVNSLNENGALGQIANGTGGSMVSDISDLTDTILDIFDLTAKQPLAWIGQAYSGKVGEPILFDASGSYDPSGFPISLFEWDFDGDGLFDLETTNSSATYTYDSDYFGYVVLRVTSPGGTALASARIVVNSEGFVSQGDEESCELDENGHSIIVDKDGIFIPCTADRLPEKDQEGVREITGVSTDTPTPQPTLTPEPTPRPSYRNVDSGGLGFGFILVLGILGGLGIYVAMIRRRGTKSSVLPAYFTISDGRTIQIYDGLIIGRGSDSGIRLSDRTVSRQHARVRCADGAWFLQDMSSRRGTFVNGRRIQATRLNNGDHIVIGSSTLVFRI